MAASKAQMIPSIRAFISAPASIDFAAAELSGPKITISLTSTAANSNPVAIVRTIAFRANARCDVAGLLGAPRRGDLHERRQRLAPSKSLRGARLLPALDEPQSHVAIADPGGNGRKGKGTQSYRGSAPLCFIISAAFPPTSPQDAPGTLGPGEAIPFSRGLPLSGMTRLGRDPRGPARDRKSVV